MELKYDNIRGVEVVSSRILKGRSLGLKSILCKRFRSKSVRLEIYNIRGYDAAISGVGR